MANSESGKDWEVEGQKGSRLFVGVSVTRAIMGCVAMSPRVLARSSRLDSRRDGGESVLLRDMLREMG